MQTTINRSLSTILNQLANLKPNKGEGAKLNPINSIFEKLDVPGYNFFDEEISESEKVSSKQPTLITKDFSAPNTFLRILKNVSADQSNQVLPFQGKALGK